MKEGETREKIDSARAFFSSMGYKNGHVTIDASDWYYNSKLLEMHRNYGFSKIKAFKKLYSAPSTIPAVESIIWSLAKERNPNDPNLRYPAEDSRYEEEDMTKFFSTLKFSDQH